MSEPEPLTGTMQGTPKLQLGRVRRSRPEWVGNNTLTAVIDLIRRNDGISRTELARHTGLSAQGMSKVLSRLLEAGVVQESGRMRVGVGKPRTRLSIVGRSRFALGIHLDRSGFSMALVDLSGRIEDTAAHEFTEPPSPTEVVDLLGSAADRLLEGLGADRQYVIGCGLGMAGPLDHRKGILTTPNNFFGWKDVPVAQLVAARIGTNVMLDKSTNMATIAENWKAYRPGWTVVIYVGTGVGAGLMLDGAVYRGVHSDAGEFGHMMLDPDGPLCVCGRRGCVEVLSSPASVVDRYRHKAGAVIKSGHVPAWDTDTLRQLRKIGQRGAQGDQAANAALAEAGRLLGIATGNLVTLLDVEGVIIAGPMLGLLGPTYVQSARDGIAETRTAQSPPVDVAIGELRANTIALGAALHVFASLPFD